MSAKLTFGNLVKPASSAADAHSNNQAWRMQQGQSGSSLKGMEDGGRKYIIPLSQT